MLPQLHTIGRVAGKHGFHGELVLQFQNESFAKAIEQGDFLFVCIDGKGVPFLIERFSHKSGIVKLADVDSSDQASELEGMDIQTENETASEETNNFDATAWIGIEVLDETEKHLGTITGCEEYPAGPMFLVNTGTQEVLIPLVDDWILEVNEEDKYVIMDIPEGLIDL